MFGFPSVERKVFKRNFLKTAIFSLEFDVNFGIDKKDQIQNIFNGFSIGLIQGVGINFKIENGKQFIEKNDDIDFRGFELKSENDSLQITIEQKKLVFKINTEQYTSFESFTNYLLEINELFALLNIEEYSNLSIRKINVVEFVRSADETSVPQTLLSTLINKKLVGDINYFGENDYVVSNISNLILKDNNHLLNLRYGLNSPKGIENEIRHILVDIEVSKKTSENKGNLINEISEINSYVFDAFCWVTSGIFKNLLEDDRINEV